MIRLSGPHAHRNMGSVAFAALAELGGDGVFDGAFRSFSTVVIFAFRPVHESVPGARKTVLALDEGGKDCRIWY